MTDDRWRHAQDLFEKAVTMRAEERLAFLAEACGGDADLKSDVESLLDHDSQLTDDFMRPASPKTTTRPPHASESASSLTGGRIGAYHIKSLIGSGGMGDVYEAVQDQPRRVVALKVMKRNVASRSALRRFQFEAQLLGRMRHPNVAQVYEAGMHDDGAGRVPYFAMEYIPGARTISEFAREKKLSTRDRLRLFAKVCDAVHHGHQKSIIHRDLKPANILIDSTGEPKVIDFGVARATDSDLSVTTQQTHVGQLVGTIQYMSPEQCDADPHDLDTRADVYSLGIVLYELLTGELPYEATCSTIYEAARVIKEETPRRLSSINPKLRGDVETIVLKAIEKDRDRRYQSAGDFAEDVRHVIHKEPIVARPPSLAYLTLKFVQRRKWQAATIAASAIGLVAMLVATSVWGWAAAATAQERATREREAAATERANLLAEKEQIRVASLYGAMVNAAESAIQQNDSDSAAVLLRRASKAFDTHEGDKAWEWRHLDSRVDQSIRTLVDRQIPIRKISSFAVGANQTLAAAIFPSENKIRIYDVKSGESVAESPDWLHNPSSAALDPSSAILAIGSFVVPRPSDDRSTLITLWQCDTGPHLSYITGWAANDSGLSSLAFSPDGRILASGWGGEGYRIRLWDVGNLEKRLAEGEITGCSPLATLEGHRGDVMSLSFSPDGSRLASGACDRTVRLWDIGAARSNGVGTQLAVLYGHTYHVYSVAFSPDGRHLASASIDKTIRLWDVEQAIQMASGDPDLKAAGPAIEVDTLRGHSMGVRSVAFDETGTRLISGGDDCVIRVWGADRQYNGSHARYHEIRALRGHGASVISLASLRNGGIISASQNGTVKVWLQDIEDVPQLVGHYTSVSALAFVPDSKMLASVAGNDLIMWDTDLCTLASRDTRQDQDIHDVACWDYGGRTLLAGASGPDNRAADGCILLWDLDRSADPRSVRTLDLSSQADRWPTAIAVSDDGKRVATGGCDGRVYIWSVASLLNDASPVPIAQFDAHCTRVHGLAFLDEGGDFIASGAGSWYERSQYDRTVRVWNVSLQREVESSPYIAHEASIASLAISPERDILASGSLDTTIQIWSVDWDNGEPCLTPSATLEGHADAVTSLAFHPTEPRLASGSADRTIRIWDTNTRVSVCTLHGPVGGIRDLAFDSTGERLAAASSGSQGADNVVWLWETEQPAEVLEKRARHVRGHR